MNHTPLQLEVVSDIVCPWCYIGKRRMEAALDLLAKAYPNRAAPQASWLPFQLNPDMPDAGMNRADYLQRKFGSRDGGEVYARLNNEGKKEGLDFNFSAIRRQPNTLKAHVLVSAALALGVQKQVKEALMKAYFCEGADLTQDTQLHAIAVAAGMPPEAVYAALQDRIRREQVAAQDAQLRRIGIGGVPFFIINRQFSVSGAQPPEALLTAMKSCLGI